MTEHALARETLEGLLADGRALAPPAEGRVWEHVEADGERRLDPWVYHGAAGIGLVFCLGYEVTGERRWLDAAAWSAVGLLGKRAGTRGPYPGLFVGEAGVAALLLRLHRATGDGLWLDRASRRLAWAGSRPPRWTELLYGAAGVGLTLLDLHAATGEAKWLDVARAQAAFLRRAAVREGEGAAWAWEPGAGGFKGQVGAPGLAHGGAGVALFLLELARRDREHGSDWRALADAALRRVADAALLLDEDRVAHWPRLEGRSDDVPVQWCHGAPGVGLAFARAYALTGEPEHLRWAERAGRATVAAGDVRGNPSYCHGLAGNLELLVELERVTGDASWAEAAAPLWDALPAHRRAEGGVTRWASDDPGVLRPGLATGAAGVAAVLLRRASADRLGLPLLEPRPRG